MKKNTVELVGNQTHWAFGYFWYPSPTTGGDLSWTSRVVQLETPEALRTFLQARERVTSIDFKTHTSDTNSQSVQEVLAFPTPGSGLPGQTLPFGLSTTPMEFTVVAKEVKLMALQRGIRIHQYLDDWLVRASTHDACLQHTQTLVTFVAGEQGKARTGSQTSFQLRRLPVRPERGQGQTHTRALAGLDRQDPVNTVRSGMPGPAVHVPQRSIHSNRKQVPDFT